MRSLRMDFFFDSLYKAEDLQEKHIQTKMAAETPLLRLLLLMRWRLQPHKNNSTHYIRKRQSATYSFTIEMRCYHSLVVFEQILFWFTAIHIQTHTHRDSHRPHLMTTTTSDDHRLNGILIVFKFTSAVHISYIYWRQEQKNSGLWLSIFNTITKFAKNFKPEKQTRND